MRCPLLLVCLAATLPAQNQGLQFTTGINGMVDVPFSPMLVPPTGLTVEAVITFDDATIPTGGLFYWPTIARQNVAPNAESWLLRVGSANTGNRNVEFSVRMSTGGLTVLTYTFQAGEFLQPTHLAGTFDGTTMRIFKNGVQVSQRATPSSPVQNFGGVLRIGNGDQSVPGNEAWNGTIDELRIWPFPRTAGEIASTMNLDLQMVPGKVVTFNLNGSYVDSSQGLIGTPTGPVNFVPTANLTPFLLPGLSVGSSTTTCPRTIDTQLGSVPTLGNPDFAIWCTQGPLPTASPLGLVVGATSAAPTTQPPFFGVALMFDVTTVLFQSVRLPPTVGLGNARVPLPIPNNPNLLGASFVFQFGFADSACGPQGFTGSDGMAISIR